METKGRFTAKLEVELPEGIWISTSYGSLDQGSKRIVIFRSDSSESVEDAESIVLQAITRINEALDE